MVIASTQLVEASPTIVLSTMVVAAVTLFSLAVGMWRNIVETRRNRVRIDSNQGKLEEIHIIVNSRYDDLVKYVKTLSATLEKADISVPSPFDRGSQMTGSAQTVEDKTT